MVVMGYAGEREEPNAGLQERFSAVGSPLGAVSAQMVMDRSWPQPCSSLAPSPKLRGRGMAGNNGGTAILLLLRVGVRWW